ncbi:MAG: hypothetical protein IJ092_06895 [Atopobiaceae bacterium]|nr:hypothetical protein [Atopobiaceae bacterium]
MAGRIEVAQGYITIIPSLKGVQKRISAELKPAAVSAGKEAGNAIESGVSEGAAKGAKSAAGKLNDTIPKAAENAGKDAGKRLAEGMRSPAEKASDEVSKSVQKKLSDGFKGLGDRMRGIGEGMRGAVAKVGSVYSDAFADMGRTIKASPIGKLGSIYGEALSEVSAKASSGMAALKGTVSGTASFVGEAFSSITGRVGRTLSGIANVAKAGFSFVREAASAVVGPVVSVFKGMATKVGSVLGSIGGAAGKALSSIAKVAAPAVTAVTAAVGAIAKSSLDAFGDFQQLSGGIKLSLGDDVWSTVEERSKSAFSEMQISQNDYLERVNLLSTGLKESLGGDARAAADLANRVIRAQADIVSAKGIDPNTVSDVFMSVSRGMYQTLDSLGLGIKGTKEGMQEVIDKANEWRVAQGKAGDLTIDSMADCQQALVDYVDYLGLSGYAAMEGAKTVQGSISKMKGAWTDWVAELGKTDDEGNYIGDMSRVTKNLSESVQDVVRNVAPVAANAVGSIVRELPGVISSVAPELSSALVSIVDEATGGLATKAVDLARPITDALGKAFGGAGSWLSENSGALGDVGAKLSEFGGKVAEALGGYIEAVGPIVEGFANAALPALSSSLDLASGALDFLVGLVSHLGEAFGPVIDAVGPVAEQIGGALCDAMSDLGGWLSSIDWDGWASTVSGAVQGVVDFVGGALDAVKGFFEEIGNFIADPVGYIQDSLLGLATSTDVVSSSFSGTASDVSASAAQMVGDIDVVNSTVLNDKTAAVVGTGNATDGTLVTNVGAANGAIGALSGKTVSVSVTGNVAGGAVAGAIWNAKSAIDSLYSKTVDVVTNYRSTSTVTQAPKAAGAIIPRHADGFIATKATLTDAGYIGEAGAEAVYSHGGSTGIFPLTNRRFTGPFASEIADQVSGRMGGSGGGDIYITLNYDASADANQMVRDIAAGIRSYNLRR